MNDRTAVIILNYYGHEDTGTCAESVRRHVDNAAFFIVDNSASAAEGTLLKSCLSRKMT